MIAERGFSRGKDLKFDFENILGKQLEVRRRREQKEELNREATKEFKRRLERDHEPDIER